MDREGGKEFVFVGVFDFCVLVIVKQIVLCYYLYFNSLVIFLKYWIKEDFF